MLDRRLALLALEELRGIESAAGREEHSRSVKSWLEFGSDSGDEGVGVCVWDRWSASHARITSGPIFWYQQRVPEERGDN